MFRQESDVNALKTSPPADKGRRARNVSEMRPDRLAGTKEICLLMMCPRDHGEPKPNFYHACASKIFPRLGIKTRFVPNLQATVLYRILRIVGIGQDLASASATAWWVFRNRSCFDLILGWHGSGLLLALLRAIIRWRRPRLCLILYRLYNPEAPRWQVFLKHGFFKLISGVTDLLLTVDRSQARCFEASLKRKPDTTICFRYGVDYEWFDRFLRDFSVTPVPNRIFCPGSAYRDDDTLMQAVSTLDVELWRSRLSSGHSEISRQKLDKATIVKVNDLPYPEYIAACLASSLVVISAHNDDKPVGLTALLECMAIGRPVVITKGLSSHDYVIDGVTALEFERGDWLSLQKQVSQVLHEPKFADALAKNARDALRDKYDISKCGAVFAERLLAVLNRHTSVNFKRSA